MVCSGAAALAHVRPGRGVYVVLEIGLSLSLLGTNWCPGLDGSGAAAAVVAVRALILASTTTLTPIQLPSPLSARERPTDRLNRRRRHLFF